MFRCQPMILPYTGSRWESPVVHLKAMAPPIPCLRRMASSLPMQRRRQHIRPRLHRRGASISSLPQWVRLERPSTSAAPYNPPNHIHTLALIRVPFRERSPTRSLTPIRLRLHRPLINTHTLRCPRSVRPLADSNSTNLSLHPNRPSQTLPLWEGRPGLVPLDHCLIRDTLVSRRGTPWTPLAGHLSDHRPRNPVAARTDQPSERSVPPLFTALSLPSALHRTHLSHTLIFIRSTFTSLQCFLTYVYRIFITPFYDFITHLIFKVLISAAAIYYMQLITM